MNAALQDGLREHRDDRQIALVREHWTAVRRLWLGSTDFAAGGKIRSNLPDDFMLGCGIPGLATIRPTHDGRFEFTSEGLTALVIPAYDTIPGLVGDRAERHVEELRDLVAVDLDHPDRFWRRRGEALVLGSAYLEIAGETCEPITVFKTPLTWLRSGGAGIVVLNWASARALLLDHELIAEDLELGDRLEAALAPDIWIRGAAA